MKTLSDLITELRVMTHLANAYDNLLLTRHIPVQRTHIHKRKSDVCQRIDELEHAILERKS